MIGLGSKSEVITITMVTITITKKVMVIVTGAKIGLQSSARMAGEKLYCPLGLTSNHCNLKMCWCWRWLCCPLFFLNQCHIQMLVIMIRMITMSTIYDILWWSRCNCWKWICRNIQFKFKNSLRLWFEMCSMFVCFVGSKTWSFTTLLIGCWQKVTQNDGTDICSRHKEPQERTINLDKDAE